MGSGGAAGRAARPGPLAGGGALPDPADHAGASRGVHGAGDAVPHPARREPPRPQRTSRGTSCASRSAACSAARRRRSSRRPCSRRFSSIRSRSPRPSCSGRRASRRTAWRSRARRRWRGAPARRCCSSPDTGPCPPSTSARTRPAHVERSFTWLQSLTGDAEIAQRVARASFAIPAVLLVFTPRTALLFAGAAAGLLVGAGVVRTGGEVLAPRAHVLRRAPGHVHSERRLARADARHDDARRAGGARQGARVLPTAYYHPVRPDRRRRLHARCRTGGSATSRSSVWAPARSPRTPATASRMDFFEIDEAVIRHRGEPAATSPTWPTRGPARASRCGRMAVDGRLGLRGMPRPRPTTSSSSMRSRRTRSRRTSSPARPWRCTSRA